MDTIRSHCSCPECGTQTGVTQQPRRSTTVGSFLRIRSSVVRQAHRLVQPALRGDSWQIMKTLLLQCSTDMLQLQSVTFLHGAFSIFHSYSIFQVIFLPLKWIRTRPEDIELHLVILYSSMINKAFWNFYKANRATICFSKKIFSKLLHFFLSVLGYQHAFTIHTHFKQVLASSLVVCLTHPNVPLLQKASTSGRYGLACASFFIYP